MRRRADAGHMLAKRGPNPIDKYVGSRIRMQRLTIGMSQEKLGDALGLTFQQVQKYEKGTNRVSASRLHQICSILHVPPAFFFQGVPTAPGEKRVGAAAPSPNYVSEFLASSDGLALVKAFVRVGNPKLRRAIVAFVRQVNPEKD